GMRRNLSRCRGASEDVPVEVEDRLPRARTDVDLHLVVGQAGGARRVRHELEHVLRLARRELADLAKRIDVPLGGDGDVNVRLRVDVVDGNETLLLPDVGSLPDDAAEEAVVTLRRQGSPPP